MCGIFGAVRLTGQFARTDYDRFVKQTDLVSYRGPDDAGYQAFDLASQEVVNGSPFNVFLGHRRLAIIDLSPQGHQPLTDGQGRWIIFVGEIFNYVELREELRKQGETFRTATDTEVILKIYTRYGEAGFDRLNGMWAFALVDLPGRRIVLSRDRFSIKPLYYLHDGDCLYFGSEIKQLLPFAKRRSVDRGIMHAYLTQAIADHTNRTFFEGIRAVRAKHSLVGDLAKGDFAEAPYWDYQHRSVGMDPVEQFRDLFVDSVRIRLRSDVEVGALLSGGLDSSAVAVAANRLLGATVRTYSIVADESRYSEARFIDMLARDGIPNRQVTFDVEGALDSLGDVVYHNDEPCFGLSIVAQYVMLKRIKQETGIKVVLSGQGADECLLGYHKFFFFYVQELLNRGRVLQAASLLLASLVQRTALWQFRLGEAQRYLPFQRLRRGNPYVLTEGELEPVHRGNGVVDRQRLDIDRYSVPLLTHFEDRNAMAHSIEMRNPFLDHRLVELALCLPVEMKLRGGWSKYVLRAALPELPAAIRWRRDKQGFITPEEQWLRAELRPVIEQAFTGENSLLGGMGILDPALFLASYRQFLAGDPRVWYADISRVFVAELWARRFLSAD